MKPEELEALFLGPSNSIKDAAACINRSGRGLVAALVVDDEHRLMDVVTDGDIRRAVLDGLGLDTPVLELKARKAHATISNPLTAPAKWDRARLLAFMRARQIHQLPLLDEAGRVVDLVKLTDLLPQEPLEIQAVVMAGGHGTRLRPLTADLPKPMLPVGDRPLLELTIEGLRSAGIQRVNVTTHFLPEKIKDHFGDGSRFGVDINYINEDTPLGTAGALALMEPHSGPLLVMNGDILTQVDFRAMVEFHREQKAQLTVAVREYDVVVPYGVVECDGPRVKDVREKPTYKFFVNAGIYLIEQEICELIPKGERFDMPDLINKLIKSGQVVANFPIMEYWLDIGQHADYAKAQTDFKNGKLDPSR